MFICNDCKRPTPPSTSQRKVVTETRQSEATDTKYARTETVKEISVCPVCAKERGMPVLDDDVNTMHAFTHQHQAAAAEGAS